MKSINFNPIKIIKGEQKFTITDFEKEYKDLYNYNNRSNFTKNKIDQCINYIILDSAGEIERDTWYFEYSENINPLYLYILNDTTNYFTPEILLGNNQKSQLVELEFCLYALLLRTKYFFGYSNFRKRTEQLSIIKHFTDSYNSFVEDRETREF